MESSTYLFSFEFPALDTAMTTDDGNEVPIGDEIATEEGVAVGVAVMDPLETVLSIK